MARHRQVTLRLDPRPEGIWVEVLGYDGEGRLVEKRVYEDVKLLEIRGVARVGPHVQKGFIVITVEDAETRLEEGKLVIA